MSGKTIHEYTDEELNALSTDDLARLRGDHVEGDDGNGDGTGTDNAETEEERLAREQREKDEAAASAAGGGGDLDPDAVARLAAESDDGAGGGGGSRMVPHSRFNEVNEERRLLLEEVLRLRALETTPPVKEEPAPPAYDFKTKRKEYHKLLLEDPEAAAVLLDEIEDEREKKHRDDLEAVRRSTTEDMTKRFEQRTVQDAVARETAVVFAKYPFLDNNSQEADETAIYAVIGKRDKYMRDGMSAPEAIAKAANEVGEAFAKLRTPPAAAGDNPSGTPPPGQRQIDATKRAADAANRQPPVPAGGIGNGTTSGKLDINKLTDDQLLKMARESPDELAQLRGDTRIPA